MIKRWTGLINNYTSQGNKGHSKIWMAAVNLLAFIRLNIFVKTELQEWPDRTFEDHEKLLENVIQRVFFQIYPKHVQNGYKN